MIDFLKSINLTEVQLLSAEERLPLDSYHLVWSKAFEISGDAALGLHVGMYHNHTCMSLVSNLFIHSDNLEEGIDEYVEYAKLLNTGMEISVHKRDDEVVLKFQYLEKQYFSLQEIERTLSLLVQRARRYIKNDLVINYVNFEGVKPLYSETHKTFFNCPIGYGAPHSELSFSSAYLTHVSEQKNPYVHSALILQAEKMKKKLLSSKMTEKVSLLITKHLSSTNFSVEVVAEKLHMNRQTLYRKLKAENQNFKNMVDKIRQAKAFEMLRDSDFSLNDVSYYLGFSEPSAFSRAFKRWTGDTPKHYQKVWQGQLI